MGTNETYNENSRVIARYKNTFVVTNSPTATINDLSEKAAVIDTTGKTILPTVFIDYINRPYEIKWEPVEGRYSDYIKERKTSLTQDALLGQAIGDALGVPVEFLSRKKVREINLKDMLGSDTEKSFNSDWGDIIPAGSWSDDTSMAVATISSIINTNGEINYDDIMNNFNKWWDNGEFTSIDKQFGLGYTVSKALKRFKDGVPALDCGGKEFGDNGNGALMRILPFSIYCIEQDLSEEETLELINEASSLTHAHEISQMSCFIYTEFLKALVKTKNPEIAYSRIFKIDYEDYYGPEALKAHAHLLHPNFPKSNPDEISENNGYVVATLESAIISILKTKSFEEALLYAINFGYDTDTIGAVTGGLAGVTYGYENIPQRWIDKLKKREYLEEMAKQYEEVLSKIEKKNLNNYQK